MSKSKKTKVVVAMSGGVDSSVAAYLLKKEGYEVIGISMRLWSYEKEATHGCCTPEDLYDARRVADQLDIPYYVSNFEPTFERKVVSHFVEGYQRGETPNPCVRCNTDVKFDALLRRAQELGAEYLATGHYARRVFEDGRYKLLRATDKSKDQSYFLFGLTQTELANVLFPLGDLEKSHVRELAEEANLAVSHKPDSQEICFVSGRYEDFIEKRIAAEDRVPGKLILKTGEVLGEHSGIHRFTVGQRRGLGIDKTRRLFVLQVHPQGNVVLGDEEELRESQFSVGELRWTYLPPIPGEVFHVKIRSRFEPQKATILDRSEERMVLEFETPQKAITPGQAAVLYRGEEVMGGGWILPSREGASHRVLS